MKRAISLSILSYLLIGHALGQDIYYAHSNNLGGAYFDMANSVRFDKVGNYIVTGSFQDKVSFETEVTQSKGNSDVFITKYDSSGSVIWVTTLESSNGSKNMLTANAQEVGIDSDGNILVVGTYWKELGTNSMKLVAKGKQDIFLSKLDDTGTVLWTKSFGSTGYDDLSNVHMDSENNIYLSGSFQHSLEVGDQIIGSKFHKNHYLMKFDESGKLLWERSSVPEFSNLRSISSIFKGSSVYIVGLEFVSQTNVENLESSRLRFVEIDLAGELISTKSNEFEGLLDINDLTVNNGAIYVTGSKSSRNGKNVGFLAKLSSNGDLLYEEVLESTVFSEGIKLVNNNGGVIVSGHFFGNIKIDQNQYQSTGNQDIFYASFDQFGTLVNLINEGGPGQDVINGISVNDNRILTVGSKHINASDSLSYSAYENDLFVSQLSTASFKKNVLERIEKEFKARIYPNPNRGNININIDFEQKQELILIKVTDVQGKTIYSNSVANSESLKEEISLPNAKSGLYSVVIEISDSRYTIPIVIE